jgi:hypothetical protein
LAFRFINFGACLKTAKDKPLLHKVECVFHSFYFSVVTFEYKELPLIVSVGFTLATGLLAVITIVGLFVPEAREE